jgi:acyl-CoA synthetase (AMP-forming)/AMP-acid ligase II
MSDIPQFARLDDYVFHYARETPTQEAILFEDRRVTYAALADSVLRWARAMLACGVGRGDRVAMLSTTRPEHLFCLLAAAHIGAVWMGLNPRFTRGEIRRVLEDARPVLLFSLPGFEDRDFRPDITLLAGEMPTIREVVSLGKAFERSMPLEAFLQRGAGAGDARLAAAHDTVTGSDTPLLVYTSGSSGVPKGVLLANWALVERSRNQNKHWRLRPPRTVNYLPINHIGGVHWISSFVLVGGGCLRLLERFKPADMIPMIKADRLNILLQVPTAYQLLSEQPDFGEAALANLEWIVWSGGAMAADTARRFILPGLKLGCSFGQTETTGSVIYSDVDADVEALTTTVGRPDPVDGVRICDEAGKPCPVGVTGEVQVEPQWIMHAYMNKPKETAEAFTPDGWLKMGDLAAWREDGTIRFVGRASDGFKSGGYNIYPREIELALEEHPLIQMVAVVGIPDALYDHVGHAFIVAEGNAEISVGELQAWCRERLANYKVPKRFTFRSELPVLPIGKVDKTVLREEAARPA